MVETICDRCGRAVDKEDACEGMMSWEGATLCPDCMAVTTLSERAWQEIREEKEASDDQD